MYTVCPRVVKASTPAGTNATRFSLVLISFGTPMIMGFSRFFYGLGLRLGDEATGDKATGDKATMAKIPFPRFPVLPVTPPAPAAPPSAGRDQELGGQPVDLRAGHCVDLGEDGVERPVGLIVKGQGRQSAHAAGGAFQGEHHLPLELLLAERKLLGRESLPRPARNTSARIASAA